MVDAPPPWEESDASEEEQHNTWSDLLELFTLQGSNPNIEQCLKDEELCKTALTRHLKVHGVVTDKGSNTGEIGRVLCWSEGRGWWQLQCARLLRRPTETPC